MELGVVADFSADLSGKVVWISGATQGLGLKICQNLSENGCSGLIMTDIRDEETGKGIANAVSKLGRNCQAEYYRVDVRNADHIEQSMRKGRKQLGRLDIVINCAGVSSETDLNYTMDVNAIGTILVNERALLLFSEGNDRGEKNELKTILNIASASGIFPLSHGGEYYAASKHAVVGYTKSIAPTALEKGVRVICLCPGWIDIGMGVLAIKFNKEMVEKTRLSFLKVDQVTDVILQLLCSRRFAGESIYMSGDTRPCLVRAKLKPLFPKAKL